MSVFASLKQVTHWSVLILLVSIALAGSTARAQSVPPAVPQESAPRIEDRSSSTFVPPPLPNDHGMPHGRQHGGASRGCQSYASLTALVPELNEYVWGTSASARPSFWFYIPKIEEKGLPLEFVLQDRTDRYVYRTEFLLNPGPADVLGVTVPEVAIPLDSNRAYHWTLSLQCDPDRPTSIVYVRGSVQHVMMAPDLKARLASASPLERAAIFANSGYWFDALTELGQLRQSDPSNLAYVEGWERLLRQVDITYPEASSISPRWASMPTSVTH
ncbi:MAG: DUF928 domain-containing protein [Cyanobacteria bacterium P01_F01_bin.33]